jgi:mannose-6-phosphate isomerase-like protein (cupin superfamily)
LETWIVRSGRDRFTADGVDIEAGSGDIIVATAGTAHKFKNIGAERLVAVCIHAAPRMIQEELAEAHAP